jgi:hypothetical protein
MKIAAHMVAEYGHEGHFELQMLDQRESELIATAFQELGYKVERVPIRNWLVVNCENDSVA